MMTKRAAVVSAALALVLSACATITISTTQRSGESSGETTTETSTGSTSERGAVLRAPESRESELWGAAGERATAHGRLLDFSYAGYAFGDKPLPEYRVVARVTDFGAVPNDGRDDTDAFKRAIARTDAGAILIPEGRYDISDVIEINKPRIVLRGEGPDKTVIHIDKALEDVRPTNAQGTLKWSWSGGFFKIDGSFTQGKAAMIVRPARQGDRTIQVDNPTHLRAGERVVILQTNDADNSLIRYLYDGDPGDIGKLNTNLNVAMQAKVESVVGSIVTLNRPLRWDVRAQWNPYIRHSRTDVHEVGIEHLAIEFEPIPYPGHHKERGLNAINIGMASDCWVRDIVIRNCDSGIFVSGNNNTLTDIRITSEREPYLRTYTGHHGFTLGVDNLLQDFEIDTILYHEVTMTRRSAGNVIKNGSAIDMALDHHKSVNHANLFTNLDVGKGTRIWKSGGADAYGKHTGAWSTFWNIRADNPIPWPPEGFAPDLINIIGVTTNQPTQTNATGRWFEPIEPDRIEPQDLHAAQLRRRGAPGN